MQNKLRAKAVNPKSDAFAADDHAALGQKVFFDVSRAQGEVVIGPEGKVNDLIGKRNTFRRSMDDGRFHSRSCSRRFTTHQLGHDP